MPARFLDDIKKIYSTTIYKKYHYMILKYKSVSPGSLFSYDMISAFSYPNLEYIGSPETAQWICIEKGVYPQSIEWPYYIPFREVSKKQTILNSLSDVLPHYYLANVCTIGWSEITKSWFGWSHRAMKGFTIGSKITKGHLGYRPSTNQEVLGDAISYYRKNNKIQSVNSNTIVDGQPDFEIIYESKQTKSVGSYKEIYPELGHGEWIAESYEDAKEMAIDFAQDVS